MQPVGSPVAPAPAAGQPHAGAAAAAGTATTPATVGSATVSAGSGASSAATASQLSAATVSDISHFAVVFTSIAKDMKQQAACLSADATANATANTSTSTSSRSSATSTDGARCDSDSDADSCDITTAPRYAHGARGALARDASAAASDATASVATASGGGGDGGGGRWSVPASAAATLQAFPRFLSLGMSTADAVAAFAFAPASSSSSSSSSSASAASAAASAAAATATVMAAAADLFDLALPTSSASTGDETTSTAEQRARTDSVRSRLSGNAARATYDWLECTCAPSLPQPRHGPGHCGELELESALCAATPCAACRSLYLDAQSYSVPLPLPSLDHLPSQSQAQSPTRSETALFTADGLRHLPVNLPLPLHPAHGNLSAQSQSRPAHSIDPASYYATSGLTLSWDPAVTGAVATLFLSLALPTCTTASAALPQSAAPSSGTDARGNVAIDWSNSLQQLCARDFAGSLMSAARNITTTHGSPSDLTADRSEINAENSSFVTSTLASAVAARRGLISMLAHPLCPATVRTAAVGDFCALLAAAATTAAAAAAEATTPVTATEPVTAFVSVPLAPRLANVITTTMPTVALTAMPRVTTQSNDGSASVSAESGSFASLLDNLPPLTSTAHSVSTPHSVHSRMQQQ